MLSCVVDPLFPDQPECKCHHGFKTSEDGICVGMLLQLCFERRFHLLIDEVELSGKACLMSRCSYL